MRWILIVAIALVGLAAAPVPTAAADECIVIDPHSVPPVRVNRPDCPVPDPLPDD